ncbi:hypothetical protein GCM10009573_15750 [Agromyces bracchium]
MPTGPAPTMRCAGAEAGSSAGADAGAVSLMCSILHMSCVEQVNARAPAPRGQRGEDERSHLAGAVVAG